MIIIHYLRLTPYRLTTEQATNLRNSGLMQYHPALSEKTPAENLPPHLARFFAAEAAAHAAFIARFGLPPAQPDPNEAAIRAAHGVPAAACLSEDECDALGILF